MTATLTTLVSFDGAPSNGANPLDNLIADTNGDLFGTTYTGGANGFGTVFEIVKTATGYDSAATTLVTFNGSNGASPYAGLIADANGDLFGTTRIGGMANQGTVFEIAKTAAGYASTPTTLVSFDGSNGAYPIAGLIADANGDLFGTTEEGGASNQGTLFEIANTATGYASTPTTLVNFNGSNGALPKGGLLADATGDLFGTTQDGGASNVGTVFIVGPPPPTGVSVSPATTKLAGAQSSTGLVANAKVATVGQLGGQTGDSFTYSLGGSGATAFSLISMNNVGTLSAGGSGVVGGLNGKLYALTLAANDTTTGLSSPALPVDVVVGSSGKDTVSLATLGGSQAIATPTFIYGVAGNDTIDGAGMTGELWFVGGTGADKMIGGTASTTICIARPKTQSLSRWILLPTSIRRRT